MMETCDITTATIFDDAAPAVVVVMITHLFSSTAVKTTLVSCSSQREGECAMICITLASGVDDVIGTCVVVCGWAGSCWMEEIKILIPTSK